MAEQQQQQHKSHQYDTPTHEAEVQDRGVFDLHGNKKEQEKPQEQLISNEFDDKVNFPDEPGTKLQDKQEPEKKHNLLDKLRRSNSSSSDEEKEGEGEKEKKKEKTEVPTDEKKGFLDKVKEKLPGEHKKAEEVPPTYHTEEGEANEKDKKGLVDKVKEKLPGEHKKGEEVPPTSHTEEGEANDKDKKGLLDKIKDKLPGHHTKPNEDKEKETPTH